MELPDLVRVRARFETPREADVPGAVEQSLDHLRLGERVSPGARVALTAGSRGIADIVPVLRTAVEHLRRLGAEPFVVPAMGSHGGATAEGQRQLLAGYGVEEATVGAPILASMETVRVGTTPAGIPVLLDRHAAEADHIGVVGRVKPHTTFHGPIESGLCKMLMIGLGKHAGAEHYHAALLAHAWDDVVRDVLAIHQTNSKLLFGLGIVENALDETARIAACLPERLAELDTELLVDARQWMARLPFEEAELIVLDRIGKEISGSGMDTNVVGRKPQAIEGKWGRSGTLPPLKRIYVRSLSGKTQGNATGLGLADFTHDRVLDALDYRATVVNCLTANYPAGANIPVHYPSDREAIMTALSTVGAVPPRQARIMWAKDTLHLDELVVSTSYDLEKSAVPLEVLGPATWQFDAAGNLPL